MPPLRIGVSAISRSTDGLIAEAQQAEAHGFASLWLAAGTLGDPLAAIAVAGRSTHEIEFGTAVLQTYPCHPLLQANRAAATVEAMGRAGFTLGLGPSHPHVVEQVYGLAYDHPGQSTDEYIRIVAGLLRGEEVDVAGQEWSARSAGRMTALAHPIPLLVAALGPRLIRVAGAVADGLVAWLAPPAAVEHHLSPRLRAAALDAARPAPRLVVGLPVAVHDDVAEARAAAEAISGGNAALTNYRRILELGGLSTVGDAAIVGNEAAVESQVRALAAAGATDFWAAIVPVGDDRRSSIRRTRELLASLVGAVPC